MLCLSLITSPIPGALNVMALPTPAMLSVLVTYVIYCAIAPPSEWPVKE